MKVDNLNQSLQRTALYEMHQSLGARLVPFAGYEMPVQFSGFKEEHLHTREKACVFDISHMGQFFLHGDVAGETLERIIPNYVTNLKQGQQRYSVLLNEHAGIIDDIMITKMDDGLMLVVNAACKDKDWATLQAHFGNELNMECWDDRALIALQGPTAAQTMASLNIDCSDLRFLNAKKITVNNATCYISRSGYTGEDGFEISIPNDDAENFYKQLIACDDVIPAGLGARDTLRLEAGLSLYGHELNEEITPLEAGLNWIVPKQRLAEATFLGSNVLKEQFESGVTLQRAGLLVEARVPAREGNFLFDIDHNQVGEVSSGSFSPCLNQPIAMAYIVKQFLQSDAELFVEVRQKQYPVKITPLPFVPHRYYY